MIQLTILLIFATIFVKQTGAAGSPDESTRFLNKIHKAFPPIDKINRFVEDTTVSPTLTVTLYFSSKHCQNCLPRADMLLELYDRYRDQVRFARFDCDRIADEPNFGGSTQCKKDYYHNLPNVYFFVPKVNAYFPYHPMSFDKPEEIYPSRDPSKLDMMLQHYMPVFSKKIKNMDDMNHFMDHFARANRTIFFSNQEQPPSYFKGMTSFFKDRLEFAYVMPDAFEVQEFFNITTTPRWIVLKADTTVKFDVRRYLGKRTFSNLRTYLSVFAEEEHIDRKNEDLDKPLTERMNHLKLGLDKVDADPRDLRSSIDYPNQIVILHIRDLLSLDYPNLVSFQKIYGPELVKVVEFRTDTLNKKRFVKKLFPEIEERPFLVMYPFGDLQHKIENKRVFASWDSFDNLSDHASDLLEDRTIGTTPHSIEVETSTAFRNQKGVMLLLHQNETISMGYRWLSNSDYYTSQIKFLTMKNPPPGFLESVGVKRIPTVIFIYPKLEDFFYDGSENLQVTEFGAIFQLQYLKSFADDMITRQVSLLKDIPEIVDQTSFNETCESEKACLLFLVNKPKEIENEDWEDRVNDMKVLRKHARKQYNVAYIDMSCFSYLANGLNLESRQMPTMMVYKAGRIIISDRKMSSVSGKLMIEKGVKDLANEKISTEKKINIWMNECQVRQDEEDEEELQRKKTYKVGKSEYKENKNSDL